MVTGEITQNHIKFTIKTKKGKKQEKKKSKKKSNEQETFNKMEDINPTYPQLLYTLMI